MPMMRRHHHSHSPHAPLHASQPSSSHPQHSLPSSEPSSRGSDLPLRPVVVDGLGSHSLQHPAPSSSSVRSLTPTPPSRFSFERDHATNSSASVMCNLQTHINRSDLIPGSPSSYLDLPPIPHHKQQYHLPSPNDHAGGGADSPSSTPEDLVLPYISRMLMEEDIDDKFFYDYPDNPALLQAQQPFLDILSDPSSNSTSDDTTSNNRVASPCSPSDGSGCTSAPLAVVDSYDRFHYEPVDPAAFFSTSANADLMNSAFLKGMEEANKFLPTQDKLVIDLEASSENFFRGLKDNKLAVAGFNAHAAPPTTLSVGRVLAGGGEWRGAGGGGLADGGRLRGKGKRTGQKS